MKLGFWNRLALVAGVVGAFAWPTWWLLSSNVNHAEAMNSGLERCLKAAKTVEDNRFCRDTWMHPERGYLGWSEWWAGVLGAGLALIVLYLIIWLVIWVAKWIWRGRQQQSD